MNYIKITKCDIANGPGVRVVLWLSGCSHHCFNCHNPHTWDPNEGMKFDASAEKELFDALSPSYVKGITFSGGDPMFEGNRSEVVRLMKLIKEKLPDKSIWMYTGYTWEYLQTVEECRQAAKLADVVVDGPFIQNEYSIDLLWRGSKNQRVIDTKKTYENGEISLFCK